MRYWPAFGDADQQSSGAYIFRVKNDTTESTRYSHYQGLAAYQTSVLDQITFYYYNEKNETARIVMRMYKSRNVTEWTLKLGGIPLSKEGQEVVLQFHTPDIDNNNTFYTDSNCLEMQERVLNYRPTWNVSSILNITQNYYPVNSAIIIRDIENGNQMSLMTTRS